MARADGRKVDELRKLEIVPGFLSHPAGSVLYSTGGTRVICAASLENSVPPWMKAQKVSGGWATSEYGMLPASTHDRMKREASSGKQSGRTFKFFYPQLDLRFTCWTKRKIIQQFTAFTSHC